VDAPNRMLPDWFERVRTGQIKLPRFQRFEAWTYGEVTDLLETVLRGLPAGATLILEIGESEPFISRQMVGAPGPFERCTEHLLDGQQRLTALGQPSSSATTSACASSPPPMPTTYTS
jgi:uncharacterized protein with ParB-like and HNH nuclease domain